MRPAKTSKDIEISERYDKEDDVYYVTVRTGEPSIAVEHDDRLLMEMGIFTRLPTGFRILNYSKNKDQGEAFCKVFKEICKAVGLRKIEQSEIWKRQIDKALETAAA
jgi:hypothetical protein